MKRFLTALTIAASAIFTMTSCQTDDPKDVPGPSIVWPSNPDFETVDIDEDMSASLTITAEAGIASLVVEVESAQLEAALQELRLGSTLDLVNDTELMLILSSLTQGQLPMGDQLKDMKSVDFNISSLVLFINGVTTEDSNHTFIVKVADNNGKTAEAACTFHRIGETATVVVSDVDLWANTATVTVSGNPVSVAYRLKGATEWNELPAGADGTYTIAPVWNAGKNAAGLDICTLEEGTGIFAGNVYEFSVNGELVEGVEYAATAGDSIPNGDMSKWSNNSRGVTAPNAEGESFWDSGNNSMIGTLCVEDNGTALMSAANVLVLTPGNMYTGEFVMDGLTTGTASFGQKYAWTARPKALKVSYKAKVGVTDKAGSSDPDGALYKDQQDTSRIYAVVVDWTERHGVKSGFMVTPSGMWDPSTAKSLDEGAIIGYAILDIVANQEDFTDAEIPFIWYDTVAKPAEDNFSVVISCATSKRGDYLTGCSTNELWVDNFQWVY